MKIQVIFQNHCLIAVFKPACTLSVYSRLREAETRSCLAQELQNQLQARIYPVHRLDCEVSGIILYALAPKSHRLASSWFEQAQVVKTYEAITQGVASEATGLPKTFEWHSKILRGKKRAYESERGKPAHTVAMLQSILGENALFWQLHPKTGRAHQLRFELTKHHFPILGDVLYGATQPWVGTGIALMSVALDFTSCEGAKELGLPPQLAVADDQRLRQIRVGKTQPES